MRSPSSSLRAIAAFAGMTSIAGNLQAAQLGTASAPVSQEHAFQAILQKAPASASLLLNPAGRAIAVEPIVVAVPDQSVRQVIQPVITPAVPGQEIGTEGQSVSPGGGDEVKYCVEHTMGTGPAGKNLACVGPLRLPSVYLPPQTVVSTSEIGAIQVTEPVTIEVSATGFKGLVDAGQPGVSTLAPVTRSIPTAWGPLSVVLFSAGYGVQSGPSVAIEGTVSIAIRVGETTLLNQVIPIHQVVGGN